MGRTQKTDLEELVDQQRLMVEALSGMRNGLIAQGFSADVAEQLVLEIMKAAKQ